VKLFLQAEPGTFVSLFRREWGAVGRAAISQAFGIAARLGRMNFQMNFHMKFQMNFHMNLHTTWATTNWIGRRAVD
jgi:hypothetical protein